MNFEQLVKAMNDTYLLVLDKNEDYLITNGNANLFEPKNIFDVLKEVKVNKVQRLTKEEILVWDLDTEQETYIVVMDK
jgi:hypothetical protein